MQPVIFVDMDGVLVDMVRGAYRLWGCKADEGHANTLGWDAMPGEVSRQLGKPVSQEKFWGRLSDEGARFWRCLQPATNAAEILSLCEGTGHRVELMSTPTRDPYSAAGKLQWLAIHFPAYLRKFNLCTDKHTKARPGALLIDDSTSNVDAFVKAGGSAFLWGQPWNSGLGLTELRRALS